MAGVQPKLWAWAGCVKKCTISTFLMTFHFLDWLSTFLRAFHFPESSSEFLFFTFKCNCCPILVEVLAQGCATHSLFAMAPKHAQQWLVPKPPMKKEHVAQVKPDIWLVQKRTLKRTPNWKLERHIQSMMASATGLHCKFSIVPTVSSNLLRCSSGTWFCKAIWQRTLHRLLQKEPPSSSNRLWELRVRRIQYH